MVETTGVPGINCVVLSCLSVILISVKYHLQLVFM